MSTFHLKGEVEVEVVYAYNTKTEITDIKRHLKKRGHHGPATGVEVEVVYASNAKFGDNRYLTASEKYGSPRARYRTSLFRV